MGYSLSPRPWLLQAEETPRYRLGLGCGTDTQILPRIDTDFGKRFHGFKMCKDFEVGRCAASILWIPRVARAQLVTLASE